MTEEEMKNELDVASAETIEQTSSEGHCEEDSLPPVPEGVVAIVRETVAFEDAAVDASSVVDAASVVEGNDEEDSHHFEGAPPVLRFLGSAGESEFDGFPEDYVSPEQGMATFGEVLVQLLDAALEGLSDSPEPLTGEGLAKIFCRGDVQDERVALLLSLLAQDQPVTGELVVAVLRAQGHEELVDGALLAREELARAGDVAVEQLSASTGTFVSLREEGQPGKSTTPEFSEELRGPRPGQPGGSGSEMALSARNEALQVAAQSAGSPTTSESRGVRNPEPRAPSLATERSSAPSEMASAVVEATP